MKVLQRYFVKEIFRAVAFTLLVFLALFTFFDLISELKGVGKNDYAWHNAFIFVMMRIPNYAYELMPIAVLIGAIYALARFAANSEFTVMRVSAMSTSKVCIILAKIGLCFAILTLFIGEGISPITTTMAEKYKLNATGQPLKQEFRTGLWAKDVMRDAGATGSPIGTRFVNVAELRPDGKLQGLQIYEFDLDLQLVSTLSAESADYLSNNKWQLNKVNEVVWERKQYGNGKVKSSMLKSASRNEVDSQILISELTPSLLSILFASPEKMSAYSLVKYKNYLSDNNQDSSRYDIAFWKKVIYPFSVFVMIALALPFGYMHFRAGGVSLKIFSGVMIGVGFILLNNFFSHLGLLNAWPAFMTAAVPSGIFMFLAIGALMWVERH